MRRTENLGLIDLCEMIAGVTGPEVAKCVPGGSHTRYRVEEMCVRGNHWQILMRDLDVPSEGRMSRAHAGRDTNRDGHVRRVSDNPGKGDLGKHSKYSSTGTAL